MRSFTLIEISVILGILVVLVAIAFPSYRFFQQETDLNQNAEELLHVLRLAQNKTLASEGASTWGVYFDQTTSPHQYILFKGPNYLSRESAFDEVHELSPRVEIGEINLLGGALEVVFDRIVGTTSQSGYILLRLQEAPEKTQVIGITASGKISLGLEGEGPTVEFTGGTTDADLASFPNNSGWGDPGQSFTLGSEDINVTSVDLYLRKVTADPSDIYLEIRQDSTVGTVLGQSSIVDGGSLPASLSWVSFRFSPVIRLSAGNQYFLRLRSIPESTIPFSGAQGTIYWGYVHAASVPPAYGGGAAWRYIGANNNASDPGQELDSLDQYDFSFRIRGSPCGSPPQIDSRHVHFAYNQDATGASTLHLIFPDFPADNVDIDFQTFLNPSKTKFYWEGSVLVGPPGAKTEQRLIIQTHSLQITSAQFSIHRDRRFNDQALEITLDDQNLIQFTADGQTTKGTSIFVTEPQWQ